MLDGKVAFITGSSRGIGWATARMFAEHGATVVLNNHADPALLQARVEELSERHERPMSGHCVDVASQQDVARAYQAIFKRYGRLDVLVNNAGILGDGMLGLMTVDGIERTFATNTLGPIHNIQSAARLMAKNGGGSIINLSSIMGTNGSKGQAVYAASKAALLGLTYSAAKELAPQNIRVNAVAPGYIDTDLIKGLTPEVHAERVASIAIGRIGKPEDVAKVITFLASDLAAYVTGQTIGVDGGMLV